MITHLDRLNKRGLIEQYCKLAVVILPVHESMLFRLYFSDGYSMNEIAQLIMKNPTTISRRLQRIVDKLEKFRCEERERLKNEEVVPNCKYRTSSMKFWKISLER